jgi:hypothetical protein
MKQRIFVKNLIVSEEGKDQVLFEGNLGQIHGLSIEDDRVLEVKGVNGVLRVDISLKEIETMIKKIYSNKSSGSKI